MSDMTALELAEIIRANCNGVCKSCIFQTHTMDYECALQHESPRLILQIAEEYRNSFPTYAKVFFDKFPDAGRTETGNPLPCRNDIFPSCETGYCEEHNGCDRCWKELYKGK